MKSIHQLLNFYENNNFGNLACYSCTAGPNANAS